MLRGLSLRISWSSTAPTACIHRQARRQFARQRRGPTPPTRADEQPPPPPPPAHDPWQEVKDPQSGQTYWWNTETNETTALGAHKPTGPVAPHQQPPAPVPQQPQSGGFMSTLAEGMAFGAGSSIARHAVGSLFGGWGGGGTSAPPVQEHPPPVDPYSPPQADENNYEWGGGSDSWGGDDDGGGDDWA